MKFLAFIRLEYEIEIPNKDAAPEDFVSRLCVDANFDLPIDSKFKQIEYSISVNEIREKIDGV